MRAYTFSEFIGRPPRDVWRVLTDLGAAPRWRPLIRSMETEDGGPLALGSRVRIVIDFHGRQSTRVSVTSEFEPEKKWTLHSSETPAV